MASKTNCKVNGKPMFRIRKKIGMKLNASGEWVDNVKNFYGKSKLDAERQYLEFMKNGKTEVKKYFGEAADLYVYDVLLISDRHSNRTKARYESVYKKYVKPNSISGKLLSELSGVDLQAFYNSSGASHPTLMTINNLIKGMFKYFESENICKNITTHLMIPDKNKTVKTHEIITWTDDEIKKIISGSENHRLRLLFIMASSTGLRLGELLALEYTDIQDGILYVKKQLVIHIEINRKDVANYLEIAKTKSESSVRQIPLSATTLKEIERHRVWQQTEMLRKGYRTNYIFTTNSGKWYNKCNIRAALERHCNRCNVPYKNFHTFRRTFCTNLCKNGVPLQVAYKLMGHSSINITAKYYTAVDNAEKMQAVEKLDAIIFDSNSATP